MIRAALLLFLIAVSAKAAETETARSTAESRRTGNPPVVGRLFFTPAERAQLDLARTKKAAPEKPAAPPAEPPEAPPPAPQIVTYGGIVRRSDGRSMLWINNRLVDESEALAGLNLKGRIRPDGSVSVQVPQTGAHIDIKVGQSVELQTGKVAEGRRSEAASKPPSEQAAPSGPDTPKPNTAPDDARPSTKGGTAAASLPVTSPAKPAEPAASEKKPDAPGKPGASVDSGGRGAEAARK